MKWNEILEKWCKKENFLILALAGLLCLIVCIPTKDTQKAENEQMKSTGASQKIKESEQSTTVEQIEAYEQRLEGKVEAILSVMEGVGKVDVYITFCSDGYVEIEKEKTKNENTTRTQDSAGGQKEEISVEYSENTVTYTDDDGKTQPVVVRSYYPEIEGVVVAAQGAQDAQTQILITKAIEALFGIDAHKIVVVKRSVN